MNAARGTVLDCARWRVVQNTVPLVEDAMGETSRWQLSFRDAMVLAAARRAGDTTLWIEDLSDGQDDGGIRVVNPLA